VIPPMVTPMVPTILSPPTTSTKVLVRELKREPAKLVRELKREPANLGVELAGSAFVC
jgi:hypothetical protein